MIFNRVLLVAPDRSDVGFGVFLARALENLGKSVEVFFLSEREHTHSPVKLAADKIWRMAGLEAQQFKRRCRELISHVVRSRPDLVLVIKCTGMPADVVSEVRSTGCAVVHLNPDHPAMDPGVRNQLYRKTLSYYDLVVTFARFLVPVFYQMGAKRVIRLPFAHDPTVHRPVTLAGADRLVFQTPVAYLGAWGPFQQAWLEHIDPSQLKVFGGLWHRLPVSHRLRPRVELHRGWGVEMALCCAGAGIVVNLIRAEHGCGHSMKTFEIPACGGFMLSNRTEEQLEFFPEGECAAYFDTPEELTDKIRFFSSNPRLRANIMVAGLRSAKDHTYEARAKELMEAL